MRCTPQGIAILLVVSAMLLVPSIAGAQITITYIGETPVGEANDLGQYYEGIDSDLPGGDPDLWDYVYNFTATTDDMPRYWGIVVNSEADVSDITMPTLWAGRFESDMTDRYSLLLATPGVVWDTLEDGAVSGTFSFRSPLGPALRPWRGYSGGEAEYNGSTWSATTPEPASMLLTSLALLGVGYWRRRKTG